MTLVMSEFFVNRNHIFNNKPTKTLKEYEKAETKERKRNLLYLIASYLRDKNLQESADTLTVEAQLTNQYEVCDNIDLDIVLQDYQSFYFTKFNKMPKIVKKNSIEDISLEPKQSMQSLQSQKRKNKSAFTVVNNTKGTPQKAVSTANSASPETFQIEIKPLGQQKNQTDAAALSQDYAECENHPIHSKSLCDFENYSSEWREMAELILREIVPKNLGVTWRDCIGLEHSIEILKETVIYPIKYPKLFTGLIAPWKGVLLFGPPGTGKTQLAKAVACESSSTFINVRSSSFISKWRGESERLLKVLFDIAKFYQPTTIFIDEIDSLTSRYEDTQHDASRRFKSELLMQMDGILNGDEQVFVLGTTNCPWNLDPAILRRFEKRILLNSPDVNGRQQLFEYFFSKHQHSFRTDDFKRMADVTEFFSGSDVKVVCKEVIMNIIREKINSDCTTDVNLEGEVRKPTLQGVLNAISKTSATANVISIEKYNTWNKKYGND